MRSLLTSLAVCAALMPAGAHAQDLSEEELLQLFLAQRDAYKAAVEGNTALTRGLTLVTADDVQIATEVAKDEPAAEDATTTDVAAADPTARIARRPAQMVDGIPQEDPDDERY